MSVEKFVPNKELAQLVSDRIIKGNDLREILRDKGIFLVAASPQDLANLVTPYFLGSCFTSKLQERLVCEQNNLKSTVLVLNDTSPDIPDFLARLSDRFLKLSGAKHQDACSTYCKLLEDLLSIEYSFEKKQKGRLSLIETKKVSLKVNITPLDEGCYKASILHDSSSDSKNFIDLLEKLIAEDDDDDKTFSINRITLDKLTDNHKIDLFDNFGSYKFDEWTLDSITNVSVDYVPSDISSIDTNNPDKEEICHPDTQGHLSGISSAILNGRHLRENDFVQSCTKDGFVFNSMRFRFEHTENPIIIEVDISFKQTDLKIIISKSYRREDDGKDYLFSIPKDQQIEYLNIFQDSFYRVYKSFIDKQRDQIEIKAKI